MSYTVSVMVSSMTPEIQETLGDINPSGEIYSLEQGYYLMDERVASEQEMCTFWYKIAKDLGLKVVEGIYDVGFQSSSAEEIRILLLEMEKLKDFWEANIKDEKTYGGTPIKRLIEGVNNVKLAADTALKWEGSLSIS